MITQVLKNDSYRVKYLNESRRKSFNTTVHVSNLKLWRGENCEKDEVNESSDDEVDEDECENVKEKDAEKVKDDCVEKCLGKKSTEKTRAFRIPIETVN